MWYIISVVKSINMGANNMKTGVVFSNGFWIDLGIPAIKSLRLFGFMPLENLHYLRDTAFVSNGMVKCQSQYYWIKSLPSIKKGIDFRFNEDKYGESWKVLRIGGIPQEIIEIYSDYDCTGKMFCKYVDSYLRGFITIGYYGIDV